MTDVILSFDTEDYVNPCGADGILRVGRILRERGYKGCFNVVGWLAKALTAWGRQDVIEELRYHEVETHSLKHSYHPTICEYTDIADFDEAMRRFRREEDEALELLRKHLGVDNVVAGCPPGCSYSYVAHYGYADMGIPIYNGDCVYDVVEGRPVTCCNIDCLQYRYCLDNFIDLEREDILTLIEKMSETKHCIAYHHPQKHIVTTFCDLQNFNKKNIDGEWILSDLLPPEKTAKFEENFRFFIDTLIADERFHIITYGELAEKYRSEDRVLRRRDLPAIKEALDADFFPLTMPDSFCLADILLACRDFLCGKEEHRCGKVYGFLDAPLAIAQPIRVTAEELRESAAMFENGKFLPTEIAIGEKRIGPADWLRAALTVLCGADSAVIVPDKWQIDLNEFPRLRDNTFVDTWVHDLPDEYLSDRLRLQTWTMRLPKGTKRRIFG